MQTDLDRVVIDSVDIKRHQIIGLIKGIPDLEARSIGVLTKCDLKQVTSDQWVRASHWRAPFRPVDFLDNPLPSQTTPLFRPADLV